MSVNEPSMEDILASIRRIIAEDQSNSLGRGGLSGLTRRSQAAHSVEDRAPQQDATAADMHAAPLTQASMENEAPVAAEPEPLHEAYESHAEEPQSYEAVSQQEPTPAAMHAAPVFEPDAPYEPLPVATSQDHEEAHAGMIEDEGEPLMSAAVGASITSSFQTLAESVMLQDPGLIERVMRESMRPLLKAWLDDHLPSIVERLVRSEIERVARGGRSRNA